MTITAQTSKTGPYNGSGTTTVFSYTFEVQDETHLVVTLADAAGGETVQVLNTDYTVSGVGNAGGGQITMTTAPASGYTLTISRDVPITQEVDLENRRSVAPEVLEDAYDKLTQIAQDFSEQLGRAIRVSVSSSEPAELSAADRAGRFLAFDASGNPIAASTMPDTVAVSAFMETVLDDTTASAARTTLGAAGTGVSNTFTDDQSLSGSGHITLTVESSGATHDPTVAWKNDNGGVSEWTARLDKSDSDKFQLRHNNTDRLTVTTGGNVGIGTANPAYDLDVRSDGDTTLRVKANSSGAGNDDDAFLRLDAAETGESGIQFYLAGVDEGYGIDAFFSGNQLNYNVPAGATHDFQVGGTVVGQVDSWGVQVTGNVTATSFGTFGGLSPYTDNTYSAGLPLKRWTEVYAVNGTINTSDIRQKQDIEELNEAELRVAMKAKTLLRKYRWKDSVKDKGEDARIHIGIMAQDLIKAFEDEGLDAFSYAMIVGNEEEGYGVRYHELLAFILSVIQL